MTRPVSSSPRRSNRPASSSERSPAGSDGTPSTATSAAGGATIESVPTDAKRDVAVQDESGEPAAIAIAALTKHYGEAVALAPLDLRIDVGQRVTIIGHNGSGKTTLLRMLAGMLEPSGGTASIAGHPIGSLDARAAVSYLSDQPVFYDDLSVWEHLEYIARLHDTEDWQQQAVDVVEMVGLTPRVDDLPSTFSRGLKQKAAIALAFVRPFDVMLVDEPFVGLDRVGRDALLELFRLAHGDGATLVVATHELSTVRTGTRLLALSDGRLSYDGSPEDADLVMLTEGVPISDD